MSHSNAKFGSRYGSKIRSRVLGIEANQGLQKCTKCGKIKAKRTAAGIYVCSGCGNKFSGGAYFNEK